VPGTGVQRRALRGRTPCAFGMQTDDELLSAARRRFVAPLKICGGYFPILPAQGGRAPLAIVLPTDRFCELDWLLRRPLCRTVGGVSGSTPVLEVDEDERQGAGPVVDDKAGWPRTDAEHPSDQPRRSGGPRPFHWNQRRIIPQLWKTAFFATHRKVHHWNQRRNEGPEAVLQLVPRGGCQ
jgi:hypothetical protein